MGNELHGDGSLRVASLGPLVENHPRRFATNRYVYPVLSRRAGGISIGINLNLDKACNFDCVYCQVDRTAPSPKQVVELPRLIGELEQMIGQVVSGQLYDAPPFSDTPEPLRRLNDIALSGDGEPTSVRNFAEIVAACAEVRRAHRLDGVKLVLITNATLLDRPGVRQALETLDANGGEIWAKLDAGTEDYYRLVDRSSVPFARVLANVAEAARVRAIVIQSLFMRIHGQGPSPAELEAYCDRLRDIVAAGGQIKLVQVYTVARRPAEPWVGPLAAAELDALAELVRRRTGLNVMQY